MSGFDFLQRARRRDADISDVKLGNLADAGNQIAKCLQLKGFCIIADSLDAPVLLEAAESVASADWYVPASLVQDGLLGEGSSRIAKMVHDSSPDGSNGSSTALDAAMWQVCDAVGEHQWILDFQCSSRSLVTLHQAGPFFEDDEAFLTDDEANLFFQFFLCRKIMVLVFLGPDAGSLQVKPYDEDANPATYPMVPGNIVVLRTDQLSCSVSTEEGNRDCYVAATFMLQPSIMTLHHARQEEHFVPATAALSEWIMDRLKEIKETQPEDGELDEAIPRNFISAANRLWLSRQASAVRGAACRTTTTWEPEVFHLMTSTGIDLPTEVPFIRWDHSQVYDPDPLCFEKEWPGTDCRHGSFIEGVELFDNKLFGLSLMEVRGMDPGQRLCLEVTYESLYRSGMKKSSLLNSSCCMYVGLGSSEWNYAERSADVGIHGATGGAPSICCGRLSFCLGCRGASISIDTEAASSLTCVHLACESVERKGAGRLHDLACGIGVHLCLSKAWWPAHSAAGFLCAEGRCFTFDSSARGHVRSEGVGTLTVRTLTTEVDNELVIDEDKPLVGVLNGGYHMNSGISSSMTAPNGAAWQELFVETCRRSGIMPYDVDAVECHGAGAFLHDAIETAAAGNVFRVDDEGENDDSLGPLVLQSGKTNHGNSIENAGLAGLLKSMFCCRWGMNIPNIHLRQLNPHLDFYEGAGLAVVDESLEMPTRSVFIGTSAFGFGGTKVHIHCSGGPDERLRPPPEPTPEELKPKLAYWPAGGGQLAAESRARRAYFLTGTFNGWTATEPMEDEASGVYGCTVTIGENGWEHFQIQIDGDSEKVLHPGQYKGDVGAEVRGPDTRDLVVDSFWFLDGRGEGFGVGERYRIRLHIAGKWRTVTWEKVPAKDAAALLALPAPAPAKYFITGEWNRWACDEMQTALSEPGLFTYEVVLSSSVMEFQIVRNADWHQVFYPAEPSLGMASDVLGPDDPPETLAWRISGQRGKRYHITFRRSTQAGTSTTTVAWQSVS